MEGKIRLLKTFLFIVCIFYCAADYAQVVPVYKGALKENRANEYRNLVNNIIIQNLSLPLNDSTEENWQDAFAAMELVQYKTPWIDNRIHLAMDSIEKRSTTFQQTLLELCYAIYPQVFNNAVNNLLNNTKDEKTFALCFEYLQLSDSSDEKNALRIAQLILDGFTYEWSKNFNDITPILLRRSDKHLMIATDKLLPAFLSKHYLKNDVVVFSFQPKNRDYPGITIVRDAKGNFIKNNDSSVFYVPQLARSQSNLPSYLTNGNTPQGVFRMDGFAVSGGSYIGPTENIQLTMPFETSIRHFLNNPKITDTSWTIDLYKKLLPPALKDSVCLYETYYAGQAGRTDIIAHGSTVNPEYYKYKPYYPITPTEGCLCTEEIWSTINGRRVESDQQLLVDAVKKAGGANGYYIVLEIDDTQKAVSIDEILPYIK